MPPSAQSLRSSTSWPSFSLGEPFTAQTTAKQPYNSTTNRKKSIQMAVRWATGKSHGSLSPINCVNFDADNNSPIGPAVDPQQIWKDLFQDLGADTSAGSAASA